MPEEKREAPAVPVALTYEEISAFTRDFKKLKKRFRSLPEDFEMMKIAAIELLHIYGKNNNACVPIEHFSSPKGTSFKVVKMACASMKGKGVRSGLRVVYFFEGKARRVTFIEIYYHEKDGSNFDEKRLRAFLDQIESR